MGKLKDYIKKGLNVLHLDLTKNIKYDRLTNQIIKKNVRENSKCIDIGAHKGEILDLFISQAPKSKHFAFEPIPEMYQALKEKYSQYCEIYRYALSDSEGVSEFNFVKNAPAYSGIKQREYAVKEPQVQKIKVELKRLDDIIPISTKIDFIKIDVEGAEFLVLKGAVKTIKAHKPLIIFECGLGASEYYDTTPEGLYDFVTECLSLKISTLEKFQQQKNSLNKSEFCNLSNSEKSIIFLLIHNFFFLIWRQLIDILIVISIKKQILFLLKI